MQKRTPTEREAIRLLPDVELRQSAEGFDTVKAFLTRFGYLPQRPTERAERPDVLDEAASTALLKYQAKHALPLTGVFDEATREMMSRPRCGLPDLDSATAREFSIVSCTWAKDTLTYAFAADTADVAAADARQAVRRAFATWSASVQIAFREVGTADGPDIRIAWTPVNCGDANMTGIVHAHADYPVGCGFYNNNMPRPIHFDDQETTWCIGAVANQVDIETVALHEIGHILGLQHSTVPGAVMWDTTPPNFTNRALQPDDIEGIRRLYPIRGPIFARHSGLCLDIEGISMDNGAAATQWEYWGGANQLFRIEWVEATYFKLIAQHSGKVIDVEAQSTADGARVHQWQWWGGNNQKFRLAPVGPQGYYALLPKHSLKCLDVEAAHQHNGARVHQWHWLGGGNQQWRLGPAAIRSRHSGKAMDVEAISTANGARLIQWDFWGGGNQKFRLDPLGDGYYRIMIEHTGKCLDVAAASRANGAQIIQWDYWGGDNQRFKPEPTGNGYYRLVAKHSGKCLDVAGISADNGAPIIQWDWVGGANQQWRL